jgi:geranylgeranyl diphosphate synthase type II
MDAEAYLLDRGERIDRELDARVPPADSPPRVLHEAMRHLLWPGGKRLRPGFALAAAEAVGGDPERAVPVATAVELIHTYSLIHDDLPCMDDDEVRRGRPSVHVAFDEATAVLAGDALLALAFETAGDVAAGVGGETALAAVRDLAHAAGAAGLVGGQVDDLAPRAPNTQSAQVAHVLSVHERKSAALFVAATVGGARLAGADAVQLEQLGAFARDVGIAFQIADDRLDEGDDDDEGVSLVRVEGATAAAARAGALLDGALGLIEDWGERAEPLRELARFAVRRNR